MAEIKVGANVGDAKKDLDGLVDVLNKVVDAVKDVSDAAEGVDVLTDSLLDLSQAGKGASGAADGVVELTDALDGLAESSRDAADAAEKLSDTEILPDAQKQAKDVSAIGDAISRVGREVASATKTKFRVIDPRASADDLRVIDRQFEQLKRMSRATRDALRFSGQENAAFHEVDWARTHIDPKRAAELRNRAYQYVTRGTQFAPSGEANSAGGPSSLLSEAAKRLLSGAGKGGGQVGGIVADAASKGMEGAGFGGALRFGALGMLGFGAFKAASAVNEGYENAKAASLDVDRIKRGMGDLGVNFETLRDAAYESAKGLGLNANESTKLAVEMNRTMGGFKSATDLLTETRNAAGFARSFGMGDPSQSGAFFASMRLYGASKTDQDNRKLALQIGEVISRSGMSAKADEVLAAIQGYVAETSRNSLSAPNASAYGTAFGGLMGLGLNGMTGDVASSILSSANRSMMNMGAAGEAGQNFTLAAYEMSGGRLNPIQAAILAEGGLFGTRGGAFGKGSAYAEYMRKQGRDVSGLGLDSGVTNFQAIRDHLDRMGGDPDLKLDMAKRYFGLSSYNQTAAMMQIDPRAAGRMDGLLKRNKIDLNSVNETGILTMGKIAGAGSIDDLRGISASLRARTGAGSLSASEREQLSSLEKNGTFDQLQDALVKIAATKEQQETEASKMLKQTKDVETAITELGTHLIGPVNTMRDALLSMANMGPKALRQRVVELEKGEVDANYKTTIRSIDADADDKIDGDGKGLRSKLSSAKSRLMAAQRAPLGSGTAEQRNEAIAKAEKEVADLERQIAETERERARRLKEAAEKRDKEKSDIDKRFRERDEAERKAIEAMNNGGVIAPSATVPQASYSNEGRGAYQAAGVEPPSSAPSGSGGGTSMPAMSGAGMAGGGAAAPSSPSAASSGVAGGSVSAANARRLANFQTTPEQDKIILEAAGGDQEKARVMRGLLAIENRGFGRPRDDATSPAGAAGSWQFMPGTWRDHGRGDFSKARDFKEGAHATSRFIDWIRKKYGTTDPAVTAAYYNGGHRAAAAVAAGRAPPAAETREYVGMMGAAMGSSRFGQEGTSTERVTAANRSALNGDEKRRAETPSVGGGGENGSRRELPEGDPLLQVQQRQQASAQGQQMVFLNGEIRLLDGSGKPVPAEVNVNPRVGPPRGTGATHVATR